MADKYMDGKKHKALLINEMKEMIVKNDIRPKMVVIQVGNDNASSVYIKHKIKACDEIGIVCEYMLFDELMSENELLNVIDKLNKNSDVNGYIVQLPLPKHINVENVVTAVDPNKDIDCFHPENVGRLLSNHVRFEPPTPKGIVHLLNAYNIPLKGKNVVIIGKSRIVGTPLALMLSKEIGGDGGDGGVCATVTLCDKWTENLDKKTREADVLIVCAGVKELIKRSSQIKENAVLIDVGIHRVKIEYDDGSFKNKIVGDIAKTDDIVDKCKIMSPSPGGCGCLTVAYLCMNVINACIMQNDLF